MRILPFWNNKIPIQKQHQGRKHLNFFIMQISAKSRTPHNPPSLKSIIIDHPLVLIDCYTLQKRKVSLKEELRQMSVQI